MSSSSDSSSTTIQVKYDVFISFRGTDVRDGFTSHLYAALCRRKIETFMDDKKLEKGDEINPSLLNAIQQSKLSVVVFSKDYASSRWCLDELAKIIECRKDYKQVVIPVFYGIDPTHVRHQTGSFAASFVEHKQISKRSADQLNRWRKALADAADLSGFDSAKIKPESVFTEEIVNDVLKKLYKMSSNVCKDYEDLVGLDSGIEDIKSSLGTGSVGIWGCGGIGKTTLAEAVFNEVSSDFEVSYFMKNVRERSETSSGLTDMRHHLFSTVLNDDDLDLSTLHKTLTKERLSRTKVLIVFDDVSDMRQIESIIGSRYVFHLGSRFILTARIQQVLKNFGVEEIYKAQGLPDDEALHLLCRKAFKLDFPKFGYRNLSKRVVAYANGLPLALKVLGSSLFDKEKYVWESTLRKLKRFPAMDIMKVLEVSFNGLDEDQKDIFLDVACFCNQMDEKSATNFLHACGFFAENGLDALVDKSLITRSCNKIIMHDLVQDMGREIARRIPTRLWHHKDVIDVLTKNTGTTSIEGISFDMYDRGEIHLNLCAFSKMDKLRYLDFFGGGSTVFNVDVYENLEFASTELRYFRWYGYPMKSLSSNFHAENLVELRMCYSFVQQLWSGVKNLSKLELIDLSHSKQLTRLPNLSHATNLKYLYLEGCTSLVKIPNSIQHVNNLVELKLGNCISLISVPPLVHLKSLSRLDLHSCSMLKKCPEIPRSINRLDLRDCKSLRSLPNLTDELKYLNLCGCSELERLPDEIENLKALTTLNADKTAIKEVQRSIMQLKELTTLSFRSCKGLLLPPLSDMSNLFSLDLTNCGIVELPNSIGQLSALQNLYLGLNDFESLPASITNLPELIYLDLSGCKRLRSLAKDSFKSARKFYIRIKFVNCLNLERNGLRNILKDMLGNFDKLYSLKCVEGLICFPGRTIPEWFIFESAEPYISLKRHVTPVDDKKLVGFALCIVLKFKWECIEFSKMNGRRLPFVGCSYSFREESGSLFSDGTGVGDLDFVSDNHVFVWFCTLKPLQAYNEASFEFFVNNTCDCEHDHYKVKRCGVHLIYSQDSGNLIGEACVRNWYHTWTD